jgi:hypothetical protein
MIAVLRIRITFNADPDPTFHAVADPDPTYHFDADANLRPLVYIPWSHGFILASAPPLYAVHCPPWLHFEPPLLLNFDVVAGPDFNRMRIRIQLPGMMQIHANPDPQHFTIV